ATSALAAGANKALIEQYGDVIFPGIAHDQVLAMTSQLLGMTAAAVAGGSEKDQQVAGWVSQQATAFNHLGHQEVEALIKEARTCTENNNCDEVRDKFASLSDANDKALKSFCERSPKDCFAASQEYVANYNKTHELISQARVDATI
ncbi:hypothetical protein, partial [Acinetobacter bohemicus]